MGFGSRMDPRARCSHTPRRWLHWVLDPVFGDLPTTPRPPVQCFAAHPKRRPHQDDAASRVSLRDCVTQTCRRSIPAAVMLADGVKWWTYAGRRAASQLQGLGGRNQSRGPHATPTIKRVT